MFFHHGNVGNPIFSVPKVTAYAGVVAQLTYRRYAVDVCCLVGELDDRNGGLMVI